MGDHNILPLFGQSQIINKTEQLICNLCDGMHGDNTLCQSTFNSWSE